MEEQKNTLTPEQQEELTQRASDIQAQYITELVKLCDEFHIKRNEYVRSAVEAITEWLSKTDLNDVSTN